MVIHKQESLRSTKQLLAALGLKPLVLGAYNQVRRVYYGTRREFRVDLDGAQAVFSTLDPHSKEFFFYRYDNGEMHEPVVTLELVSRLKGAKVFADVGAHLGYFACIAGAVFPNLNLYLFEMNHNLVDLIERNLSANKLNGAQLMNKAVSDRRRKISYEDKSVDAGLSMAVEDVQSSDAGEGLAQGESVSLDEFFAGKDAPDVVKIDVQGAEMQVLRGAKGIIERHSPILFLEVHPKLLGSFGTSVQEIHEFLESHGYDRIRLITEHREEERRLVELDAAADRMKNTHMLLCENSARA